MTDFESKLFEAKNFLADVSSAQKNAALLRIAEDLVGRSHEILAANQEDIAAGRASGLSEGLIDRLTLGRDRIAGVAEGVRQVAALDDPCGRVLETVTRPNGLVIKKVSVPLGVIGIIYESRPNVTVDAAALCLKSSNAVVLRGGKEAIRSNIAISEIMRDAIAKEGFPKDAIYLVRDTSRASAQKMMKMKGVLDCLIPRGGRGLIQSVVENSIVPVIETGSGNCHIYIDASADIEQAVRIVFNAKTQRVSVCNACESLVIHSAILPKVLPPLVEKLKTKNVEIRADERARAVCPDLVPATEEDFATEYLDYVISVKTVDSLEEAIDHINRNSTKHSEAILTQSKENAEKFLRLIDSSSVYVNASTRFTDGFEFGLGAEIGISTQKLHARGPMGLRELTTTKYLIYGSGQIRE